MKKATMQLINIFRSWLYILMGLCWFWFVISYYMTYTEEKTMPDGVIIAALITGGTSLILGIFSNVVNLVNSKKKQIDLNTEEIKKLSEKVESQFKVMAGQLDSQHKKVIEDIGRGDESTLTKQHEDIINIIGGGFGGIEARYQKEDSAYSQFKEEQRDLKDTLDNFLKDYTEVIKRCSELSMENAMLKDKYKSFLEKGFKVVRLNRGSKKEMKSSRDRTRRERPY